MVPVLPTTSDGFKTGPHRNSHICMKEYKWSKGKRNNDTVCNSIMKSSHDSDQCSLPENPATKFSCCAGGSSRQLWSWDGRWGKWAHTLSCTLTFTMFLPNLLYLYFQLLVLTDAVSTDDSMSYCSGQAAAYAGDMEGWEGNVRVTHVSENKKGLMS